MRDSSFPQNLGEISLSLLKDQERHKNPGDQPKIIFNRSCSLKSLSFERLLQEQWSMGSEFQFQE